MADEVRRTNARARARASERATCDRFIKREMTTTTATTMMTTVEQSGKKRQRVIRVIPEVDGLFII